MNKKLNIIVLGLILIIAVATRFYMLGAAPAGLYVDEAIQGYSAYSLSETGKDEFGKSYPIIFRSFLDFKTPIYTYTIVPLIDFFGLTKFTVRLPSAMFSILTFLFLYLLIKNLIVKRKSTEAIYRWLPIIISMLLAISPWHILFARTAFEVNISVFFLVSGLYYFYKSIGFSDWKSKISISYPTSNKNGNLTKWYIIPSSLLFSLAIPSYHAQRIITPLLIVILAIRYRSLLFTKTFRKPLLLGILLAFFISLPTLSVISTPGFIERASGLNIFTSHSGNPAGYLEKYDGYLGDIVNNKAFLNAKELASLWSSYYSPRNMFVLGDAEQRLSLPDLPTFFLWQFPFYIYGLYVLIKRKDIGELRFLTITLLLISPLPAAVTRDPYSTIRSLNLIIPQIILVGLGIMYIYSDISSRSDHYNKGQTFKGWLHLTVGIVSFMTIFYSLSKLWSSVIILNEHYRAPNWNYGWEEVARTINTLDHALPIVVDNARGEHYSQLLFFLKFDPVLYQNENYEMPLDEYYTNLTRNTEKVIGNITTRPINWERDLKVEQYLIGDALSISDGQIKEHNLELIRDITYPDWSTAYRIVKTKH